MYKLPLTELRRLTALITDHRDCAGCLIPGYADTIVPITLTPSGWVHDMRQTGAGCVLDADYDHAAHPAGSAAPCSRYGTDIHSWAPYAAVYAWLISNDSGLTADQYLTDPDLQGYAGPVSLVVSNAVDPADVIVEYAYRLTAGVIRELGGKRALARMAAE